MATSVHSPSVDNDVLGTPGRLGRKQALTDLKAAAAASPTLSGQEHNATFASPSKRSLRSKLVSSMPTSPSKAPSSAPKRLPASSNLVTPRFASKKPKNRTPMSATLLGATTVQKENIALEDSPLRMRAIANRRTTLKKPSKSSIKVKGLKLASDNGSRITTVPKGSTRSDSPMLTPKHTSGKTSTVRPKSSLPKTTKGNKTPSKTLSDSTSGIRSTTSGLNIHNLASLASSHLSENNPTDVQVEPVSSPVLSRNRANVDSAGSPVDPPVTTTKPGSKLKPDPKRCDSPTLMSRAVECFSKSESLLNHIEPVTATVHSSTDDEVSVELDNILSFHAMGQKLMEISKSNAQGRRPDLKTPLSIPTVVLPAIDELDAFESVVDHATNVDESIPADINILIKESIPRSSMPITASHSTATCGTYATSVCPSTPSRTRSTLLVTPNAKRLPRTAPSTPSSSPNSGFSFYNLLLPFNAQTGKALNPQQERTQLELWRLRASAAGVTTRGAYASGALKTGSNVPTSANTNGWSVLERARTFGETLWSSPQIRERAEKAKRKGEEEDKAKELEYVAKKLKVSQQMKDAPVGSPMRQMMMAQTFWSAKMMDFV